MGNDKSKANKPVGFKFFVFPGKSCPYVMRTNIVLLELGIPFTKVEIPRGEKPDWFLELNPRGKVPAMQHPDGYVVYESAICNEFLSDLARQETETEAKEGILMLMPTGAYERARVRLLCDQVDNMIIGKIYAAIKSSEKEETEKLIANLEDALGFMEKALGGEEEQEFLGGKEFTIADAHFLPFFNFIMVIFPNFLDYSVPEEKFPLLLKWFERCSERESFKSSVQKQGDAVAAYKKYVDNGYKW